MKDKIDASEADKIQKAIDDLKETLKNENASKEEIDEKLKVLTEASHKLAEQAYAQNQGNTNSANNAKKDDDVIDAEVE